MENKNKPVTMEKLPFREVLRTPERKASATFLGIVLFMTAGIAPLVGMLTGKLMTEVGKDIPVTAIIAKVLSSMLAGGVSAYILGLLLPLKPVLTHLLDKGGNFTPKKYSLALVMLVSFVIIPIGTSFGVLSNPILPQELKPRVLLMHIIIDSLLAFVIILVNLKRIRKFIAKKFKDNNLI